MYIKSIRQAKNLRGKRVFLRADFNVPIEMGKIKDDYRIIAGLSTIRFLLRYKCKIIIAAHLGRPLQNKKNKKYYSTKPIAIRLGRLLDRKVKFIDDCIGAKVEKEISKMKEGDILVLENLRFYKEEENNDKKFAKNLASLADIYVNDAFAVSHRENASIGIIKKYLPAYAGLALESEIENLSKALKLKKPLAVVIGGAKIETKISLLKKMKKKAKWILVGGAIANNFLLAIGNEVGRSLVDKDYLKIAKKLYAKKVILPIDVVVSDRADGEGKVLVKSFDAVGKKDFIFDIGPDTIKLYAKIIKEAETIVWNGPVGKFESEHFKHGTMAIARIIAAKSDGKSFGIAGGGETIEALKVSRMIDCIDWVSTGGGAMLAFLGGEKMPGLKSIVK